MFSEFDEYLKLEFLIDYWSDEGINIASAMLEKFMDEDWNKLKNEYQTRTNEWQIKCAEVLDMVNHPISLEILIGLLAAKNDDVVVAAADSLRSKTNLKLPMNSIERLTSLSRQGSAPVKAVLVNLLGQLGLNERFN